MQIGHQEDPALGIVLSDDRGFIPVAASCPTSMGTLDGKYNRERLVTEIVIFPAPAIEAALAFLDRDGNKLDVVFLNWVELTFKEPDPPRGAGRVAKHWTEWRVENRRIHRRFKVNPDLTMQLFASQKVIQVRDNGNLLTVHATIDVSQGLHIENVSNMFTMQEFLDFAVNPDLSHLVHKR